MDQYYELDTARECLSRWMNDRKAALQNKSATLMVDSKVTEYVVTTFDGLRTWRLCTRSRANTEAVFRVQGIIGQQILPPVLRDYASAEEKAKERARGTLRQSVTLTGLGLPDFDKVIIAIEKIHVLFDKAIPHELYPWEASECHKFISFDASSKFFTRSKPGVDIQPFDNNIDPEGNLTALINHKWVHTTDNVVVYKQLIQDIDSNSTRTRMSSVSPNNFKIGDVVEASIAFAAFRLQDNKVRMFPILRGLLHLDGEQSDSAHIERMRIKYSVVQRQRDVPQLKRSNPFEDEDENADINTIDENKDKDLGMPCRVSSSRMRLH